MSGKLTPAQLRKIWTMAREVYPAGEAEDLLRGLVKELTGSDRISTLTPDQASRVINALMKKSVPTPPRRPGMASDGQLRKIKALIHALGWNDNPRRLRGFLKKYAGIEREEWLTAHQAWRVIEGLKATLKRQEERGGTPNGRVAE